MIALPTSTIEQISGVMAGIFTDFLPLILLIIGTVLGVWFLGGVIQVFQNKKEN